MRNRILLYAAVYGTIGVIVGVLMALYTKDVVTLPASRNQFSPNSTHAESVEEPVTREVKSNVDAAS
jgi:hypothetical protein